ncbi:MAG: molybdenum cofactor guanylyltransferase, partial [Planctomycetota bacterium]
MPPADTSNPEPAIPLYILCGGHSERFGADKARVLYKGAPLIQHVARALDLGGGVIAVADVPDKYADLGLKTIADAKAHQGPMGGIDAALRHCQADWFLLAACDQLMVRRDWVDTLVQRVTRGMASGEAGDGADAVAYRGKWYEPMPALYRQTLAPIVC